ncbi:MAG TPA: archease [Actinomycetota bacterium]|nr:archease [Actinomycetota bacterium]
MDGFEILEHTADVGIRARSDSLEGVFEQATWGLFDIMGARVTGPGETIDIQLEGRDVEGLLVDWLNEVLYLQESRDAVLRDVKVERVTTMDVKGSVSMAPRQGHLEGTAVKAVTYHQLRVARDDDGRWTAEVFVDV